MRIEILVMPVPDGRHDAYARGDINTRRYRDYGGQCA